MARIPEHQIQQLLASTDIVDLVSGYLALKRAGTHYKGLCPFHQEKTPSFTVNPVMGIFKCFGCGKGGNAIGFLMEAEGLSWREAAQRLAERCGMTLAAEGEDQGEKRTLEEILYRINEMARDWFIRNLQAAQRGKGPVPGYLSRRGLDHETCTQFQLGYAPDSWSGFLDEAIRLGLPREHLVKSGLVIQKEDGRCYDRYRGRLIFPIRNVSGAVIGFGGRVIEGDDQGAKYINSPETEVYHKGRELYGIFEARNEIRRTRTAILVEGYMDLISLWTAGIRNVVASLGTALTSPQAALLRRFAERVIFLYDGDKAGQSAMGRGAVNLLEAGLDLRVCRLPDGLDPDDTLKEHGREAVSELIDSADDYFKYRITEYRRHENEASPQEFRDFVVSLAEGAARIQDTILRHEQFQRIHRASGIPVEEIARLAKLERRPTSSGGTEPPEGVSESQWIGPEHRRSLELFSLFMRNPEVRQMIIEDLDMDQIHHPFLNSCFSKAIGACQDANYSVESWAHSLENRPMRELALGELVEGPRAGDLKSARDILFLMQSEPLQSRLKEINALFRVGSITAEERVPLEQEFMALQRSLARLRSSHRQSTD
jgi:DNA primase